MLGGASLFGVDGKFEDRDQSGAIVFEHQLAIVQMGDGFGERETETGTFVGPARIEATKAAARLIASFDRDTWTAVGHFDADETFAWPDANPDFSAARAIADRVFDEVADRLCKQLAMAE